MISRFKRNIWDPTHVSTRLLQFYAQIAIYYTETKYTDVNIICRDGCSFKCHRLILAAGCKYFDSKFGGSFVENASSDQEVKLENIDGLTFKYILEYVYKGLVVDIDDANVYKLLVASDFLGLPDIERHCVHYLTEKRVPAEDALRLHLFACRAQKHSIMPATSRFIVQHLDSHFCQDEEFLKVPFEELSSVLTHVRTTSANAERALLQVILRWVNNSIAIADNVHYDDERSTFLELTKRVPFRYLSSTDITKFVDAANSSVVHQEGGDSSLSAAAESLAIDGRTEFVDFGRALHVFIATKIKSNSGSTTSTGDSENDSNFNPQVSTPVRVFSIKREKTISDDDDDDDDNDKGYGCDLSILMKPEIIRRIRIVESNGRLYCLKRLKNRWRFSSGTSIDELSDNMQRLRLPSALDYIPLSLNYVRRYEHAPDFSVLSMCGSKDNVFLFGLDEENVEFQYYNKELDSWFPVLESSLANEWKPIKMTSNEDRLYTFLVPRNDATYCGGRMLFTAYDPRVGLPRQLNTNGLEYMGNGLEGCCSHRGKIFVSEYDNGARQKYYFKMAVYDPVAGAWDVKKLEYWSQDEHLCDYPWPDSSHQLVSFDNNLWIVGSTPSGSSQCYMWTHTYDSFRENVNVSQESLLAGAVERTGILSIQFEDLVTFKP